VLESGIVTFAQVIKKWRGNTPRKIACDIIGVNIKTLQAWEQGVNKPHELVQESMLARMSFCTEHKPWAFWKFKYTEAIKQVAAEIGARKL